MPALVGQGSWTTGGNARTPVGVVIGLDLNRGAFHATVLTVQGEEVFARAVANDERDLDALLDEASGAGIPALVIDQRGPLSQLAIAVARRRAIPVAYVPGLIGRRTGEHDSDPASMDHVHSFVLADTARVHQHGLRWLDESDTVVEQLRVLGDHDADLADDAHRLRGRLREALTSVSPALERAIGEQLADPGVQALLSRYPTPTALRAAGGRRIARMLRAHAPTAVDALTPTVLLALAAQTVTVATEAVTGRVIGELAADLRGLADRRTRLRREMERVFLSHPLWTGPWMGNSARARRRSISRDLDDSR